MTANARADSDKRLRSIMPSIGRQSGCCIDRRKSAFSPSHQIPSFRRVISAVAPHMIETVLIETGRARYGMATPPVRSDATSGQVKRDKQPPGKLMNAAPLEKRSTTINGRRMTYVDQGNGTPIVFLHGNPTSSYLWRNIIPHLSRLGRCIAPDLIGMGDSEKLPDSGLGRYRFAEHRSYLHALLDELVPPDEPITLVIHDWGSALGFDWASKHPERVRGIAYMEAIVKPLSWQEWPASIREIFQALRSNSGPELILEKNLFIETILPGAILRDLTAEEMAEYRRPFLQPGEGRRPTLAWPNELPIEGQPRDVIEDIEAYGAWLSSSKVPKLFINAEPGAILIGAAREFCRSWPNQTEVTVAGSHFIQEDSPDEIGRAIAAWLRGIR